MGGRVGAVGTAAEHGQGGSAGIERATMGAGVDAEGEAADHDQARAAHLSRQLARDLAPVGGRPPRADDRHRRLRLEATEEGAVAAADQRPGRVAGVAETGRIEIVVAADRPARGAGDPLPQLVLAKSFHFAEDLLRRIRGDDLDQVRVVEAQKFGRAPADRPGRRPLDVRAEHRQQPGAAQALDAGDRLRHGPASAVGGPGPSPPRRSAPPRRGRRPCGQAAGTGRGSVR